jgi:hypothetical protein
MTNEGFSSENAREKEGVSVSLDSEKIMYAVVGRNVETAVSELIKVFDIIKQVAEKGPTSKEEIKEAATDLFDKIDADIFEYEDIFTMNIVNQILHSINIDSIFFEINGFPFKVTSGSTTESVTAKWKESITEKLNMKLEREREEHNELSKKQELADKMFTTLETLDFSDIEQTIDWLFKYHKIIKYHGVNTHEIELIKKFEEKGYSREKNDQMEFMLGDSLKDKKRKGEVLIGFMLVNLGVFRERQMEEAIIQWKKMK